MSGDNNITWFEQSGEVINHTSFKVFQVIYDDAALAHGPLNENSDLYLGHVFLITNSNGKYYYDEEIISVPTGKVVRQVGVYRYSTNNNITKTVPVIEIMDK